MRKRFVKKRRQDKAAQPANEFAGQLLSPEEQEKASLSRIMSEMGHHAGRRGGRKPMRRSPLASKA